MSDDEIPCSLEGTFKIQEAFSRKFYDRDEMSTREKEDMTVQLTAALHNEVSSLLSGLNFQVHRQVRQQVDRENIKHESVDVFRYLQSILNLWSVTPEEFLEAYRDRDLFLNMRHDQEKFTWSGQPVILCDVDDVLNTFKGDFYDWIRDTHGVEMPRASTLYYPSDELKSAGHNPEEVFERFIASRKLRTLTPIESAVRSLEVLRSEGYWVHLVTARPSGNLTCKYDTYVWLDKVGVRPDRISFESEKYLWFTKSEYFGKGAVVAVDDSAKHVREYSSHGVTCLVPRYPHNSSLEGTDRVRFYERDEEFHDVVKSFL